MKRLLFVLALLTGACLAQSGNTVTITSSGAPTGACSYIFQYIDSATGNQYNCKAGAWNQIGGGAGAVSSVNGLTGAVVTPANCSTVSFSATPTFSGASNTDCFSITLTGNVTSSTFSNGVSGQIYTFIVIQDATGSRAFVPPSQMKQYSTWMSSPSNRVIQQFIYDGTNLNAVNIWTGDTRPF